MSQIFLSYSSQDRERVRPLVDALQEDGYTVWWDREIRPGPSFDREIERAIAEAGCIVVVWSVNSVESEWVRAEVEEGARRGLLVPVMIDDVLPPLAHRRRQAANLTGWDGDHDDEFGKLVVGIEATLAGDQLPAEVGEAGVSHAATVPRRRRRRPGWPLLAATALASLMVGAGLAFFFTRTVEAPQPPAPETKFVIRLPQGLGLTGGVGYPLMITPDGRTIVFVATDQRGSTGTQYYARELGTIDAHPIDGVSSHQVTGLGSLWRGPQGEWFIYNDPVAGLYKKERVVGGTPVPIASTNLQSGGILGLDWSPDGDIVFANSSSPSIMLLKGGAGTAMPLTRPAKGMIDSHPRFTPDGRAVVYDESKENAAPSKDAEVMLLNLDSGKAHNLGVRGIEPRVTTSGHLLYRQGNVLWATAFDERRHMTYGKQVPILEGLAPGIVAWDLANNGTLVYEPGSTGSDIETHMVWLSADGKSQPVPSFQHIIGTPALSPDNSRLAVTGQSSPRQGHASIWVYSFDKQIASRLTFDQGLNVLPVWSPDGKSIAYMDKKRGGSFQLMLRAADGTGEVRQLAKGANAVSHSFTPDGRTIVFSNCEKQCDIASVGTDGKAPFHVLLKTQFNEKAVTVSPDGRWIAYESDESGHDEVFVRPWPDIDGGRWQISNNGGASPVWASDGAVLYYVEPASNILMSVSIGPGKSFSAGRPTRVTDFSGFDWQNPAGGPNFAVAKGGDRFLVIRSSPNSRLIVVLNWLDEVKRLVPTSH